MSEVAGRVPAGAATARVDGGLALVIGLLWSAGLIHAVAAIDHLQEHVVFAVFFQLLAAGQILLGVAVYRAPSRRLLRAAVVSSLGVVALWVVSRTWGVPVGPHPWTAEPVGPVDAICSADEVVLALVIACRAPGGGALRGVVTGAVATAGLCLILVSSLVLVSGGRVH